MSRVHVTAHSEAQQGFSYMEVLIVTVLITVSLIPALEALQIGVRASDAHAAQTSNQFRLQGRMEQILAESLDSLRAASAAPTVVNGTYSDPGGTPDRVLVFIARYDANDADGDNNPFSGGDGHLLWVRVATEVTGQSLATLVHAL